MGCYFSSPHSSGKPVVSIQNRSDMNSHWNCTKISLPSSIVCAGEYSSLFKLNSWSYLLNKLVSNDSYRNDGNPSTVIKSNMAAMAWYLKKQIKLPPSFAGVVTFSPVSLRTITACPAFTSRGPTSRRIGTPYKFKIKTSPKLSGDWL